MAVSALIAANPHRRDNGMAVSGVIAAAPYRKDKGMAVSVGHRCPPLS